MHTSPEGAVYKSLYSLICFCSVGPCKWGNFQCHATQVKKLSFAFNILPFRMSVLVAQSCPTLCDPVDSSPSDSSVLGILQARTLEWVAVSFSNA